MRPLLIYIHGFNSSPQSIKAEETRDYLLENQLLIELIVPALSNYPMQAYNQLRELIEKNAHRQIALIGSSLGGFMSTILAEAFSLHAVIINPAVYPSELMGSLLGDNVNPYTGEHFCLKVEHVEDLRKLESTGLEKPNNLWVLLQSGDETLDYRRAVEYYQQCSVLVEEGGDHRFKGFKNHLPAVLKFLHLT